MKQKSGRKEALQARRREKEAAAKQKQSRLMWILGGAVLALVILYFTVVTIQGLLAEKHSPFGGGDVVHSESQTKDTDIYGYWWFDENAFVQLTEDKKYRSYAKSEDGSRFLLQNEYRCILTDDEMIIDVDGSGENPAHSAYERNGDKLTIYFGDDGSQKSVLTKGAAPSLPLDVAD